LDDLRELLKKYPGKATAEDANGWQPIHEASSAGNIHALKILAQMGFNVDFNAQIGGSDQSNFKGKTPLWIAKEFAGLSNNHVAVKYLIQNGAVLEVLKHEEKEKPLLSSPGGEQQKQDQPHVFSADDLRSAAYHGDINRLEQILEAQPELQHESDENGWLAIHEAVRNAQVDALITLVDTGSNLQAQIGPKNHDGEGATPLEIALELHGEKHQITALLRRFSAKPI